VFRKAKSVVGLDIGSSQVKAVELKPSGKAFKVAAFATENVPADSIVDGAIIDADAVVGAIRRLFEKDKTFKAKDVCASLSGNTVIVKKITLPVMAETELRDSIHWEAEQYIPFDIQDVNLDYQILTKPGADAGSSMDVLLVAAKKERISDYTNVITQAGRVPVVVDVDAFALQNAYEANYGLQSDQTVVLLNAGASAVNINVIQGEQSIFTRDISIGGNAYTEAIQKELGLPFDVAEQLKKGVPVDGATYDDAQPVIRAVTENILLEIQKTLEFFKATAGVDRIDAVMLSGGLSQVDGFSDALADRIKVAVDYFDPFKAIGWDPKKLGGREAAEASATAAVAVGLALRQAGDR
jgi:type IV pilus assembly protein PilM